jgi:23S rRNA (pseudouridine1915-N3)-methyltransferase
MKITVAWIGKTKEPAIASLTDEYLKRISRYVSAEGKPVRDEEALLALCGRDSHRKSGTRATLVLLDSHGREFSSEQFASFVSNYQDHTPLPLIFAVGGPDGFTQTAQSFAQHLLSLGKMTLPHELARVVLLEQIYRAFTILNGHPYHSGH